VGSLGRCSLREDAQPAQPDHFSNNSRSIYHAHTPVRRHRDNVVTDQLLPCIHCPSRSSLPRNTLQVSLTVAARELGRKEPGRKESSSHALDVLPSNTMDVETDMPSSLRSTVVLHLWVLDACDSHCQIIRQYCYVILFD
jgi:hypothetical protein